MAGKSNKVSLSQKEVVEIAKKSIEYGKKYGFPINEKKKKV